MTTEIVDRRVLAAVRFLDPATSQAVTGGLTVQGAGSRWFTNRSGLWVLRAEGVLDDHAREFLAAPTSTPAESVAVTADVLDGGARYLPRRFTIDLPRTGTDLFEPIDVLLVPSPALPTRATWATVRVTVSFATDGTHPEPVGIEGARIALSSADLGGLRCVGLTDARGEGLAIGHGIPRFSPGILPDEVVRASVEHTLEVIVDVPATDPDTGLRDAPADPDDLAARSGSLTVVSPAAFDLEVGGTTHLTVNIPRS
ncbi:MAG: hypothetical protein KTR31_04445 [Myxococcales bacterium]|nr:hypothetical protein [Myxococcales bacterium]